VDNKKSQSQGLSAKRKRRIQHVLRSYIYLTPTILGLLIFSAGAVVFSFIISFTQWEIVLPPRWVGFENYDQLFRDSLFWKILGNTLYYTAVYVPVSVIAAVPLAILINQKVKGITFFRTIYFLPVVSAGVAVAMVWSWMYNPSFGVINYLLDTLFGIQGPRWLSDLNWAMPSVILMGVWRDIGSYMMIYLAGLQGIPEELYEAARIDGANWWDQFRTITIPMLSPTTFFVLVMAIIGSFQVFEATYIMTQGGPSYVTTTLSFWIFQNAIQWFHMGYGAALAYILFAIILTVTLIQFRFQSRWVFYR
jgi:multiple sugar transport system permease protein